METLALILARGGSKGIPLKNIQNLAGKPLIKYSIDSAINSKLVSRVVVSTDSEKIANVAKSSGAEIPFMRPKNLAKDDTSQLDVVKHAVQYLEDNEGYFPDVITILHPTNPFRSSQLLDKSIRKLKSSKADLVLGVSEVNTHPYRSFWHKDKYLKQFSKNFHKFFQRQLFPKLYFPTGDIYTLRYSSFKKYNLVFCPKIYPIIQKNDENTVNIDTSYDLFIAEMTIKNWESFQRKYNKKINVKLNVNN